MCCLVCSRDLVSCSFPLCQGDSWIFLPLDPIHHLEWFLSIPPQFLDSPIHQTLIIHRQHGLLRPRPSCQSNLYRTFQVIKPLTREEVGSLRINNTVPLQVGFHGILLHGALERRERFPFVRLCLTTEIPREPEPCSAIISRSKRCRVPLGHIRVGSLVQENVETDQKRLLEDLNPKYKETDTWIRRRCPARQAMPECWVFRSPPRKVVPDNPAFKFSCRESDDVPKEFSVYLSTEELDLLRQNRASLINCVIEITVNPEEKHPSPWMNMPAIGPFDCWPQASRLGMRIEFVDAAGTWKSLYLQSRKFRQLSKSYRFHLPFPEQFGKELDHIEMDWLHCMRVMAALLNWKWQLRHGYTQHVWVPYKAEVRIVEYIFLAQRYMTSTPSATSMLCPRLLSLEETTESIEKLLGPALPLAWGKIMLQPSRRCDLCVVSYSVPELGGCLRIINACLDAILYNHVTSLHGNPNAHHGGQSSTSPMRCREVDEALLHLYPWHLKKA